MQANFVTGIAQAWRLWEGVQCLSDLCTTLKLVSDWREKLGTQVLTDSRNDLAGTPMSPAWYDPTPRPECLSDLSRQPVESC